MNKGDVWVGRLWRRYQLRERMEEAFVQTWLDRSTSQSLHVNTAANYAQGETWEPACDAEERHRTRLRQREERLHTRRAL